VTNPRADLSVASPALREAAAAVRRSADAVERMRLGELVPGLETALPGSALAAAFADAMRACALVASGLAQDARAFAGHLDAVAEGIAVVDGRLAAGIEARPA
jgi:hypothetical protein